MEKQQPNYYSILTAEVRYSKDLSANEKLLYSEITALSGKEGYCWANNSYFADLFGVKPDTVSGWVTNLEKHGFINRQIKRDPNTKRVIERRIYIIDRHEIREVPDKNPGGPGQKTDTLPDKNPGGPGYISEDNNINIILQDNNKYEQEEPEGNILPTGEKQDPFKNQIEEFTLNKDLKEILLEFIEARKKLKKSFSETAFKRMLIKLRKLGSTEEEQIEIIENSIINGWAGIFPLDKPRGRQKGTVADYYDEVDRWANG